MLVLLVMCPVCLCRRSRGFGFIEYRDPRDADDAMYRMDGSNIGGRDITVTYVSQQNLQRCYTVSTQSVVHTLAVILPTCYCVLSTFACLQALSDLWACHRLKGHELSRMLLQVVQSKEARKTPREMIYRDGKSCCAVRYTNNSLAYQHIPATVSRHASRP